MDDNIMISKDVCISKNLYECLQKGILSTIHQDLVCSIFPVSTTRENREAVMKNSYKMQAYLYGA